MPARRHRSKNIRPGSVRPETARHERLQKVLAAAGVGSRRDCEELILEGRVDVDGKVIQTLGTRVDPLTQRIRIDGSELPAPRREYYVLNKPPGVLCTNNDPSGRARAIDLIRSNQRLFTVGRLDRASEGLILVTNDGELANRLTHPRYGIEKVYRVRVAGTPEPLLLGKLKRGIRFADGLAKVSDVRIKGRQRQSTDLEIVLNEGRNREIRRLLARIGHKVLSLTRIAMGPLRLADLPSGAHRPLTRSEVKTLRQAVLVSRGGRDPSSRSKQVQDVRGSRARTGSNSKKTRTRVDAATSSVARPSRRKAKHQRESLADQPLPGAILGGEDTPTVEPSLAKIRKTKQNARRSKGNSIGGGRTRRTKPPKKRR